jgi:hypothetical protein
MPIITPITPGTPAPAAAQGGNDARSRAISALMGNQPNAASPVQNATQISPEEMSAVSATSGAEDGQTHTSEEPAASPSETPAPEVTKAKEEPLSDQYAKLARKEKALRAEMLKLKSEREAFQRDRDQAAKPKDPTPSVDQSQFIPKERLMKDTLGVLGELGLSYEQLTQMALNAPSPEAQAFQQHISKLESKIAELEEKTTSTKKSIEDGQQQSYQQALKQIRNEAQDLVATDPEAFETIHASGSVDEVVELIERTWKEDGKLLTVEQAAREVEEYLAEEAMKYARLKKIQKRLQPAPAPTPAAKPLEASKQQPPKTLTNAMGTQRQLSARERAILAARGELK